MHKDFKTKRLNSTMAKIVNLLNDGKYHDGTSIGKSLGMSRNAVCQTIKKLNNFGIPTDSVKGKGYKLLDNLILLDKVSINSQVPYEDFELDILESIDSTNDFLKSYYGTPLTRVCIAENQTKGKGRLSRQWYSPFGQNIYLSCLYRFQKDSNELSGLSLIISLAIIKTLEAFDLPQSLKAKWPNDILYDGKKLAGCLIETQAEANGSCSVIIGIGLNVNMLSTNNIDQAWTSLRKITNKYINRNALCAKLLNNLLSYLHKFSNNGFAQFIAEWKKVDLLSEKIVSIQSGNNIFKGKGIGINKQGHLLLELEDGQTISFSYGEATILKIP